MRYFATHNKSNRNVATNMKQVANVARTEVGIATRRKAIVDLVGNTAVPNQATLVNLLENRGIHATQATLSRDLKALGIGKIPAAGTDGYVYVLPMTQQGEMPPAREPLTEIVYDILPVNNLVLVKTARNKATKVAQSIDSLRWNEVLGAIAGDDAVLLFTKSSECAVAFANRLDQLVGCHNSEQQTQVQDIE